MNSVASVLPSFAVSPSFSCPLNDGLAVVDQLLAAITREHDTDALDFALDFRLLLARTSDAATILREFFRLRYTIQDRHYLACVRRRRWLETDFVAEVRLDRTRPPRRITLSLDTASLRELGARCIL